MWGQCCQSFPSFKRSQKPRLVCKNLLVFKWRQLIQKKILSTFLAKPPLMVERSIRVASLPGDAVDRAEGNEEEACFQPRNRGARVGMGCAREGVPYEGYIAPHLDSGNRVNNKFQSFFFPCPPSVFYFLFLTLQKSLLTTHSLGWCCFGKLRGGQQTEVRLPWLGPPLGELHNI